MQDDFGEPGYTLGDLWRERRISMGAPQEKCPQPIRYRLARPEELSPEQLNFVKEGLKRKVLYLFLKKKDEPIIKVNPWPLSSTESDFVDDIKALAEKIRNQVSGDDNIHENMIEEYFKEIANAINKQLLWHPIIFNIIYSHKALGNKEILRFIKRGWETGVSRPLEGHDIDFNLYCVDKIAKERRKGVPWKTIRRNLMKKKRIPKMTRQALQKRYKKALAMPKPAPNIPQLALIIL